MSIKSILVAFEPDNFSIALVKYADHLRKKFDAEIIGFAACDLQPVFVGLEGGAITGEMLAAERQQIETLLNRVEKQFREAVANTSQVDWRSFVGPPTPLLCREARSADIVVVGTKTQAGFVNAARTIDEGELALGAGRPMLIAGENTDELVGKNILVGWKDTRESRRAVIDALPFLTTAEQVIVTTLDDPADKNTRSLLKDVVAYLERHNCKVASEVHPSTGNSGERLVELALHMNADMIVTGAFGHSRLREWAFGGVTRTLLGTRNISRFMSN